MTLLSQSATAPSAARTSVHRRRGPIDDVADGDDIAHHQRHLAFAAAEGLAHR